MHPVARADCSRQHPDVRDLLGFRTAFNLEDDPGGRPPVPADAGSSSAIPTLNRSTPAPVIAEPKKTGCTTAPRACFTSSSRSRSYGRPDSCTYAARIASFRSASNSDSLATNVSSFTSESVTKAARLPASCDPDRDDGRRQALRDLLQDSIGVGSRAVDLVHKHERRNAEPLQGAYQDPGLRLDTLDGRDHEHRTVEHAEDTFNLGDEVRMAGRVDQVDVDIRERERRDG